jgi:DUF1680 family protein
VQRISIERLPDRSAISTEVFESGVLQNVVKVSFPATGGRVTLIPYYAWNNRGNGSMIVWIPKTDR